MRLFAWPPSRAPRRSSRSSPPRRLRVRSTSSRRTGRARDTRGAVFRGGSRSEPSSPGRAPTTAAPRPAVFGDDVRPPPRRPRRRAAPARRGHGRGDAPRGRPRGLHGAVPLKKLRPGRGRDKEDKHASDASTTVSVSDILDDLERQLFLASPASAGVAHHESPLSALARGTRRARRLPVARDFPGMFDTRAAETVISSAMDVRELDDAIEFVADVPGARDEDLQVEVLKKDPNAHRARSTCSSCAANATSLVDDGSSKAKTKKRKSHPPAGRFASASGLRRVRKPVRASAERGRRPRSAHRPRRVCACMRQNAETRDPTRFGTAGTAEAGGQARRRRRGVTRQRRCFRDVHELHG